MTQLAPRIKASLVCLLTLLSTVIIAFQHTPDDDPLSTFEIAEGFQIELMASEPLLADPVAMEVDEQGNIYVAEMPDYPLDTSGKGRIVFLKDTNGDGKLDQRVLFAEDIVLPTGLMRWKRGLLVTAPPDLLYLEDADNDGKAEIRNVVLTGFARSNPQHNFNKPVYGLDNWIYLANNGTITTSTYQAQFGGRGEAVYYPAKPEGPRLGRNANDRNVRFKPDSFALESLAGRSQFGQTFDRWGHHFLLDNSSPQFHEVIAARYLERNPSLSARMAMQYTPDYGRNTVIYPITIDPEHQLLTDRGMITSAAGITYYQGGLFPAPYAHASFVGEPVHNLVHALKVEEAGPTFKTSRIEQRKEFLASTDSWFRPVNFYVGPDGALYVVDYYRQIVEHPEWMDEETAKSGKLQHGTEKGRLYRITPTGTAPADWISALHLGEASTKTLVSHLQSSNIWWRIHAQRLLVEQQDAGAAPLLEQLLLTAPAGETRVHALWTLEGLGKIQPRHIQTGLTDPVAGVRENAIILAEMHAQEAPELWASLLTMKDEPNTRVRFQLLCTLGYLKSAESQALRQQILLQDMEDNWIQLAALTTFDVVDFPLFSALIPTLISKETPGRMSFIRRISALIAAASDVNAIGQMAQDALDKNLELNEEAGNWWKRAILAGIADGLPRSAQTDDNFVALRNMLLTHFPSEYMNDELLHILTALPQKPAISDDNAVAQTINNAKLMAQNTALSPVFRAQAIILLAHLSPEEYASLFRSLMTPDEPVQVQQAAIKAYGKTQATDVADVLTGLWTGFTPDARNAALDVLMAGQPRMASLLDAVEKGIIQPSALGWERTVRLMRDTQGAVKEKARLLLSEPAGVRDQVVTAYYASLSLNGDVERGGEAFERVCSTCHQVGGKKGVAFGPDLGTVRHWSARALLAKILKPEKTIADGYGLWSIKLKNGRTETGLIGSESPSVFQLRRQGGEEITISRDDVASLQSLNATAMPAGLESQINKQEMADLIAYLRFN